MKDNLKNKLPLFVGIGIPLLLILWVLLFVYFLPRLFVKPEYNFVYAAGYESNYVRVVANKVQIDPCPYYPGSYQNCALYLREMNFYLYDVKNDENISLSLDEVKNYQLDPSEKSPDDYKISFQKDSGDYFFFPFFGGGGVSRGPQLSKGAWSKQIELKNNYYDFQFLGWVAK